MAENRENRASNNITVHDSENTLSQQQNAPKEEDSPADKANEGAKSTETSWLQELADPKWNMAENKEISFELSEDFRTISAKQSERLLNADPSSESGNSHHHHHHSTHHSKSHKAKKLVQRMIFLPVMQFIFSLLAYLLCSTSMASNVVGIVLIAVLILVFLVLLYIDTRNTRHLMQSSKEDIGWKLLFLLILITPAVIIRLLKPAIMHWLLMLQCGLPWLLNMEDPAMDAVSLIAFYFLCVLVTFLELPITKLRHRMGF